VRVVCGLDIFWLCTYSIIHFLFCSFPAQVDWVGCGGRDALLAGGQLLEQGTASEGGREGCSLGASYLSMELLMNFDSAYVYLNLQLHTYYIIRLGVTRASSASSAARTSAGLSRTSRRAASKQGMSEQFVRARFRVSRNPARPVAMS